MMNINSSRLNVVRRREHGRARFRFNLILIVSGSLKPRDLSRTTSCTSNFSSVAGPLYLFSQVGARSPTIFLERQLLRAEFATKRQTIPAAQSVENWKKELATSLWRLFEPLRTKRGQSESSLTAPGARTRCNSKECHLIFLIDFAAKLPWTLYNERPRPETFCRKFFALLQRRNKLFATQLHYANYTLSYSNANKSCLF